MSLSILVKKLIEPSIMFQEHSQITFYKFHGTGNDFIIIDGRFGLEKRYSNEFYEKLSPQICDRRFGVGCDQLLLIRDSPDNDCDMIIYNQDGSLAEMCGNGVRCCALFIYHYARLPIKASPLKIHTAQRVVYVEIVKFDMDMHQAMVKVNMGVPKVYQNKVYITVNNRFKYDPKTIKDTDLGHNKYEISNKNIEGSFESSKLVDESMRQFESISINMGNPHHVIHLNEDENDLLPLDSFDIERFGPQIERSVPQFTNVEFAFIESNLQDVHMRVWERGANETYACGSGACATAVSYIIRYGGTSKTIHMKGGKLEIEWEPTKTDALKYPHTTNSIDNVSIHNTDHYETVHPEQNQTSDVIPYKYPLYMTGPATFVFKGEYTVIKRS